MSHRLRCVPRILANRNSALGRPLGPQELEDVQQDSMLVIWKKLPQFMGRSSLETWFYQICNLELLSAIRRRRRDRGRSTMIEPSTLEAEPSADLHRFQSLYKGMEKLSEEEARIVSLKHYEERTFDQIAATLSMSASQVKSRYYRALLRLRDLVRDGGPEVSR